MPIETHTSRNVQDVPAHPVDSNVRPAARGTRAQPQPPTQPPARGDQPVATPQLRMVHDKATPAASAEPVPSGPVPSGPVRGPRPPVRASNRPAAVPNPSPGSGSGSGAGRGRGRGLRSDSGWGSTRVLAWLGTLPVADLTWLHVSFEHGGGAYLRLHDWAPEAVAWTIRRLGLQVLPVELDVLPLPAETLLGKRGRGPDVRTMVGPGHAAKGGITVIAYTRTRGSEDATGVIDTLAHLLRLPAPDTREAGVGRRHLRGRRGLARPTGPTGPTGPGGSAGWGGEGR